MRLPTTSLRLLCCTLAATVAAQEPKANERATTWPDGAPKERYTVDERGDKHGQLQQWAQNGTRTLFEVYSHGRLHGAHREWTEAGAPVCSFSFQNDQLHGLCEAFHANGRTASTGTYREGKRTGKWTELDASGERRRLADYRDGLLHGNVRILQKAKVLTRQTWKRGELVDLDGLQPFPLPRNTVLSQLRAILATETLPDAKDPKAELRQAALLRLRAYRQLCGLPHTDMVLWQPWNELCDAAAEVCHQNGKIDHHPAKPAGIDEARYKQGTEGARNSNLAIGGSVVDSVDSYMDDSDPSNIDRIGHRRWCLNPTMEKVAFGTDENFHAMWSMDGSGSAPKGLDAYYYPPPGYVPVDLFSSQRAFSIAMKGGGAPKADELRPSIRPLDSDYLPGEPLELDAQHTAGGGFGTGTCLVFRAKDLQVAVGSRYLVEVSTDGGKSQDYRYVVEFCEPVLGATK
ncbi:MAG: hypothetical protein ABIP94_15525 [Planctomycetota bacterium]